MISGWGRRDDYWTNTNSPGFARDRQYRGCLETRRHGSSGWIVAKKNGMWLLRDRPSELLRQDSAAGTGTGPRGVPGIPGGGRWGGAGGAPSASPRWGSGKGRLISADGAYLPDRGQRSGAWAPNLVWRGRPV